MGNPINQKGMKLANSIKKDNPKLSYRDIAKLMESKMGRKVDPKEVWRWLEYANVADKVIHS